MHLFVFFLTFLTAETAVSKENPSRFIYREPVVIGPGTSGSQGQLGEVLSQDPRFNHYENQSLRSFSSVFLEGVDQRFLELSFHGFSVRDPSTPTGVFNLASFSALKSQRIDLRGGAGLAIESARSDRSYIEGDVSNLGEASAAAVFSRCRATDHCQSFEAVLKRGGGFSQMDAGVENDYFEEVSLSGSRDYRAFGRKLTSHFFYYGQQLDLDSVGPLSSEVIESLSAEALNSIYFIGQEVELSKKHKLMLSYTNSYRNQKDEDLGLSFRQSGEVLESTYVFDKDFRLKVFSEHFDLYSSSDEDIGFDVQKLFSWKDFVTEVSIGKTELRSLNWSLEAGYKNFVIFYKGLPPSLFQQSYNNEFSSSTNLRSQSFVGMRHSQSYSFFDKAQIKWSWSYSRIFDFVDFDLNANSYKNLERVENFFMGLDFIRGPLHVFVQNQVARQIGSLNVDLPRRAPWTLGLRVQEVQKSFLKFNGGIKWLSKRPAFDQTELEATWLADLGVSYKNFNITLTNVFSNQEVVFKNLSRKPFSASLSFQKNF